LKTCIPEPKLMYRVSQNKIPQHENHYICVLQAYFAPNFPRLFNTQYLVSPFIFAGLHLVNSWRNGTASNLMFDVR